MTALAAGECLAQPAEQPAAGEARLGRPHLGGIACAVLLQLAQQLDVLVVQP